MSATSAASARTGERYFISGVQTARRAAGFGGLERLYDRHCAAFGYPADQLKPATIGGLREQVSWQSALDALMRAVEIDPEEIEWQRWLALVFEELGRIDDALLVRRTIASLDPDSLENNFAIGRLLECKGKPVRGYYAQVLTNNGDYLLALARTAALSPPTVIEQDSLEDKSVVGRMLERKGQPVYESDADILTGTSDYHLSRARGAPERLKERVRGALIVSPANVALQLAMGFIGIAERDEATTRKSFLIALVLAEQPGPKEGCDPWSLVFAQGFLLDQSDKTTSRPFLPVDPIRFALARAALLLSHGAMVPALREYLAAASPLLVQKLPHAYQIYNGYKIVLFKNQLYGVPKNVRDFSILRGRVIGVPDADEGSGLRLVRSRFAALLSDWQRARLKYLLRVARPHIQIAIRVLRQALRLAIRALRQALRLPGRALRLAMRMLRRLAGGIYLRRHIVGGVLVDNDVAQLQQRIDAEKGGTGA
jgi:tetratricopeptide (TPR) repeat protein